MKPIPFLFVVFIFFVTSCASSKLTPDSGSSRAHPLVITADDSFEQRAPVRILVRNTSSEDTLQLYKPRNLVVEKKKANRWVRLRTLYCPCGASCPAPPEMRPLHPGMTYTYRWDQMEEWCGEMTPEGIPEMHRQFPGSGQYRIAIRIFSEGTDTIETHYKQFTIKE